MKRIWILILISFVCLPTVFCIQKTTAGEWLNINGKVTHGGIPVCAMVVANGQYMFTCKQGDDFGKYELDVPLDSQDQITIQAFVSGLAPFRQTTDEFDLDINIAMQTANPESQSPDVTTVSQSDVSTPANWARINGTVTSGGTSLCAMVLANGQYMFSCGANNGVYDLTVPLDKSGQITLYVFVSGLQPFKKNLSGFLVPDTGQTDPHWGVFGGASPPFGVDSDYTINPQSYTKLSSPGADLDEDVTEWAMVRDNVTGLIWEVKTDDGTIHDKDDTYSWSDANTVFISQLNSENFGGHNDWRLPTIKELAYLVDHNNLDPAINIDFFPNTQFIYCSSTSYVGDDQLMWGIAASYGTIATYSKNSGSMGYSVRAVRGESTAGRLVNNGDGTVTDTSTGLMWQQSDYSTTRWQIAMYACETLDLAGYTDWRLPSRNELVSLVDYSIANPAINNSVFPIVGLGSTYWSSTTNLRFPDDTWVWCIDFAHGRSNFGEKYGQLNGFYYRAVRGGNIE